MIKGQNLFLDPETILTDQWLMSFSSRGCNFNAPCGNRAAVERDINRFRAKNRFCPLYHIRRGHVLFPHILLIDTQSRLYNLYEVLFEWPWLE